MSGGIFDENKEIKIRRSFNLSISVSEKVDEIAFNKGKSKSEVVEKALVKLFEKLENEDK